MIEDGCGQHTMRVRLAALPPCVEALFLTMSAWNGDRLGDVVQPYIR
jgi:hypothetical protein